VNDPERLSRFQREAPDAGGTNHANIATYTVSSSATVMTGSRHGMVSGETLAER